MAVCVGDATQLDVRYWPGRRWELANAHFFKFYFNVMTYIIPAL